jgi:hypothetical protein
VTETITRPRCAWKLEGGSRCPEAAKPRGKRGPIPRHCPEHTAARKRQINHHPIKPRSSRPECCADGHQCPQHEQFRDEIRLPVLPLSRREADWLAGQFGEAESKSLGFHITGPAHPKYWNSNGGPIEGRTRPTVFHADPFRDAAAEQWFESNDHWYGEKFTECVGG